MVDTNRQLALTEEVIRIFETDGVTSLDSLIKKTGSSKEELDPIITTMIVLNYCKYVQETDSFIKIDSRRSS